MEVTLCWDGQQHWAKPPQLEQKEGFLKGGRETLCYNIIMFQSVQCGCIQKSYMEVGRAGSTLDRKDSSWPLETGKSDHVCEDAVQN